MSVAIQARVAPETRCDLGDGKGEPHTHGSGRLRKDPLGRYKVVGGKTTTEVMRLCNTCYSKVRIEKLKEKGARCNLDDGKGKPHSLGSKGLLKDPLGRWKVVDGEITTEVMKLCRVCYESARLEKLKEEGVRCDPDDGTRCDLDDGTGKHTIVSRVVKTDPLGRCRVVNGEETTKVMKLCKACYERARLEKLEEEGVRCDLDDGTGKHTIQLGGVRRDPLSRRRVVDGKATTEVMKLCRVCYESARRQKKQDQKGQEEASLSKEVKEEPEMGDEECSVVNVVRHPRKINNGLPILQDPQNPTTNLLAMAEGPVEDIQCANWYPLRGLSSKVKKEITDQAKEWVVLNATNPDEYKARLERSLEVLIPLDDGPERGQSVFAREPIKQYQVVCPYAGKLHPDEESLNASIRSQGSHPILSYLFAVRSSKRVLDACTSGNVASVVNTSQLKGFPAFKENNLIPLTFGKNLVFYIALKDIERGEELFIDYGPTYDPDQFIASAIKQEGQEETPVDIQSA